MNNYCKTVLPAFHRVINGRRILADIRAIMDTDRWNSFDRFHDTTKTLCRLYESAGAQSEVYELRTGGAIGSGRWLIHEAVDVKSATADVVSPTRRRILDYSENPWHVIQWSAATPKEGLICPLVVLDTAEDIERLAVGSLAGKVVLTRITPRNHIKKLAGAGALAVISDFTVQNNPDAVAWIKFGWGGLPIEDAAVRLVGLAISENQGAALRQMALSSGSLTIQIKVDISRYSGHHDVVSGLVVGRDDPQNEVWALAHTAEPGSLDNASGVAICVAMARAFETLIAQKRIRRPRRTIRFINAYECHGFFKYLESVKRFQRPMAGVDLDTLGALPAVCDGRLEWHAGPPMSAGFVNRVGERMLRAALRIDNPGYQLTCKPFSSPHDALMGDPKYGFPCPWLTTCRKNEGKMYDTYHSSGETIGIMSAPGVAVCATAMAGYLGYLADAGTTEALEWAASETRRTIQLIGGRGVSPERSDYLRELHHLNLDGLRRWLWGGDRGSAFAMFSQFERQVSQAAPHRRSLGGRSASGCGLVPRRTAPIIPCLDNIPSLVAKRIRATGLPSWALYWADGARNLTDIKRMIHEETGNAPTLEQVKDYFLAHREIGYVELAEPKDMVTLSRIAADLKALGVRPGMDVMLHSSLSAIGDVAGGPDSVIDAILRVIGNRGNLMMPSFNHHQAKVFNPLTTPTTNGAIPDAFWRRPEAFRSDHPTHSVAIIGPKAEGLCRDHAKHGLWTETCPMTRWVHEGGHILSIGVTHSATTALHVAECSIPCGCIDLKGNTCRMVGPDGGVLKVSGHAFRSEKCPVPVEELSDLLVRKKLQCRGNIGHADSTLVKAIDLWRVRREQLSVACPDCDIKPRYRRDL